MSLISSIVVGVDFSPSCASALREALRIAQWNRAPVRAVHVIDTIVAAELGDALSSLQTNVRDALTADARAAWQTFAATVPGADAVAIDVRIDQRVRGILAAAADAKADLLVLGAFGDRRPDVGLGSVATNCVRHGSSRVLIVRDNQPGAFRRVVAAVDFSPTSLRALDQAARIATQDSAELHVLHAFRAPWHDLHYRAPTLGTDPAFQTQYRAGLERRLHAFAAELGRETGFLKPTFALIDDAGHRSAIVDYATRVDADLVVLGTRGRSNLRDILLGSTAEKVLRDSPCSVLAIRPE